MDVRLLLYPPALRPPVPDPPRARLSFEVGLLKGHQATGIAPLPAGAIADEEGIVRTGADTALQAFARLLYARFGDRLVVPAEVQAHADLRLAYQRLGLAGGVVDDILADASARRAIGRIA